MALPAGIERRSFGGEKRLATRGEPIGSERTRDDWREWDPHRSKVAAMLEFGMETGLTPDAVVLYLGAAAGTTVSHVADVAGPTYAVEFAPRPVRDLLEVAADRPSLFPLLEDARRPETYAHVVESPVDVLIQDVATTGQARVAALNARFLADDGRLLLAIKARSEDVTREPAAVFDAALEELESTYEVLATADLAPYHEDHLGVLATPREARTDDRVQELFT
ncbi:MAG: fibrillarin-like rRNA/tRNA 2'-O-methyltransferase [Halodesulfurarchaeum sp.]